MSNKSVLGSPSVGGNHPKTGFSVGYSRTFTCSAGQLLPTYRKFLNIGEKISGIPRFFLRTQPLLAPSMTDIDVYVDCFFVPMNHIFSMFDQWFTQVNDSSSDLYTPSNWKANLPVLGVENDSTLHAFKWMTKDLFEWRITGNNYGTNIFGLDCYRLVESLGYPAQALFINCDAINSADTDVTAILNSRGIRDTMVRRDCPRFSPYFFAAYQKIYYDVYRDTEYETNNVSAYNFDSVFNVGYSIINPALNAQRDQYGYNSRMGMFQLRYRNRNKDYFTAVHPHPVFNVRGFLPTVTNLENVKNWLASDVPSFGFGNSDLSVNVSSDIDYSDVVALQDSTSSEGRYYFKNGHAIGLGSNVTTSLSGSNNITANDTSSDIFPLLHSHQVNAVNIVQDLKSQVDLASLRSAFALDELLRTMNRAGRHVDSQMYALFGVKMPKGIDNEVYRIKSYHTMVHLGEVVSTAQTEITDGQDTVVTPLGEMAGRGVAVLNEKEGFEFTAPCHGIFMTIFSIAPRYKYIGAIKKDGFKVSLNDFFRPQTQNLGMQPIFSYEMNSYSDGGNTRAGWQYERMEDKISFDSVSNVFATNGLNPWAFCSAAPYRADGADSAFNKVSSQDLDNLFVQHVQTALNIWPKSTERPNNPYYPDFPQYFLRDPFIIDYDTQATLVSEMSRFGEPELGGL